MKTFQKISVTIFLAVCFMVAIKLGAQLSAPLGPMGNMGFNVSTISAQTATLTGNQMAPGLINTTFSGATTLTLPPADQICALFPQYASGGQGAQGFAYDWYLKSNSSNTNVIPTAGTGDTIVGLGTTANSTVRHFKVVINACNFPGVVATPPGTVTIYSLETSTF